MIFSCCDKDIYHSSITGYTSAVHLWIFFYPLEYTLSAFNDNETLNFCKKKKKIQAAIVETCTIITIIAATIFSFLFSPFSYFHYTIPAFHSFFGITSTLLCTTPNECFHCILKVELTLHNILYLLL